MEETKIKTQGGGFVVKETLAKNIFTPEDFSEEQLMMKESVQEFVNRDIIPNRERFEQKDYDLTKSVLENNNNELDYKSLSLDQNVAKISVIGMGMMSQSGVAEKMFKTLAKNAINILAISTSEIKISVLILVIELRL